MKEETLDLVKMKLIDISDYSLTQFYSLALREMKKRGIVSWDIASQALLQSLKDCDPTHGD